MTNAPIVKVETTLANFGPRDEVRELADRLKVMMPGGQTYTTEESLTLAQISVAHDLDPFNGEVWLIKNEDTGKVYGALIGLKGLRKHAKRQANYWGFGNNGGFTRITDPSRLKELNATDNAIVFEYRIMDEQTLEGYTKGLGAIMKTGVNLELAQKILGPAPVTIGIGIWSPGDKTKMKPAQAAMFRAEKDCLKRRFDVKWRIDIIDSVAHDIPLDDTSDPNGDEIEEEYDELFGSTVEEKAEQEEEIIGQLGFTTTPPTPFATMSLETAMAVKNRDGIPYVDLDNKTLSHMANTLQKSLNGNGMDEEERETRQYKLDACRVILASRETAK